uniref:Uncharacterized protein n=1 Tax=Anopheles albimanus TaxID=7167 RepID=A0A182FWH7_ANOAL
SRAYVRVCHLPKIWSPPAVSPHSNSCVNSVPPTTASGSTCCFVIVLLFFVVVGFCFPFRFCFSASLCGRTSAPGTAKIVQKSVKPVSQPVLRSCLLWPLNAPQTPIACSSAAGGKLFQKIQKVSTCIPPFSRPSSGKQLLPGSRCLLSNSALRRRLTRHARF